MGATNNILVDKTRDISDGIISIIKFTLELAQTSKDDEMINVFKRRMFSTRVIERESLKTCLNESLWGLKIFSSEIEYALRSTAAKNL